MHTRSFCNMLGAARGWILTTERCLELRQKVKNVGSTVPRNDKYASEPASAETQARGHRVILELYARRAPEDLLSDVSGAGPAIRPEDYFKEVAVLVAPGFGETGRGCLSITALLLMQFLFL